MKVAIFDYDMTMTNRFVTSLIGQELEDHKLVESGFKQKYDKHFIDFESGKVKFNEIAKVIFDDQVAAMKGLSTTDFTRFIETDFPYESYQNPWVKVLFEILHSMGFLIVVVSGSFELYLEAIQEKTGFDSYFGSRVAVKSNEFTGEGILFMNDVEKERIVKQLCADADFSIAFGDSDGDIKMLELVDAGFLYRNKNSVVDVSEKFGKIKLVNDGNIIESVKAVI